MKLNLLFPVSMVLATLAGGCNKMTFKLSIPDAFREQASAAPVAGSRTKHISFAGYNTSKIKRGAHVRYPGWSRGFFLENLVLNHFGIGKAEQVEKEKARFRYTISNGKETLEVVGREQQIRRSIEYKLLNKTGPFNNFSQLQQYSYVFSVQFADPGAQEPAWEMVLSNYFDREKEQPGLFTIIRPDDPGIATNGKDTFYIRPLSLQKAELPNGKEGKLLFKVIAGYEISTSDGVVAITDLIHKDIWLYNELTGQDKIIIAAITSALYARRVKDLQW